VRTVSLLAALLAPVPAVAQETLPPLPAPRFVVPADVDLKAVLPPFPAKGSLAERADIETMLAIQARRTREEEADAQADSVTTMPDLTLRLLGSKVTPASHPKLFAMLRSLHDDMRGINRAANAAQGFRARPQVYDTRIRPSLDMVGHGNASYPSARTSSGYVWAGVIGDLFPSRRAEAEAEAERVAWRRVLGGVHYPSDLAGSRLVAAAVLKHLRASAAFRREMAMIKAEIAAAGS
jgi:acid phosphatase (class A)